MHQFEVLSASIEQSFRLSPRIHKAGRYGFGPSTAENLLKLGFDIDLSPAAAHDYSADGGPDFSLRGPEPSWIEDARLLCIPNTGAFIGPLAGFGPAMFRANRAAH